jgi:hypothetical protein
LIAVLVFVFATPTAGTGRRRHAASTTAADIPGGTYSVVNSFHAELSEAISGLESDFKAAAAKRLEAAMESMKGLAPADVACAPRARKSQRVNSAPTSLYYPFRESELLKFQVKGALVVRELVPKLKSRRVLRAISESRWVLEWNYYLMAWHELKCSNVINFNLPTKIFVGQAPLQSLKLCDTMGAGLPFHQALNLHDVIKSGSFKRLAMSKRLGHAAATLLQVKSVRLYQTAYFRKEQSEVNNVETAWHRKLDTQPMTCHIRTTSSNRCVPWIMRAQVIST